MLFMILNNIKREATLVLNLDKQGIRGHLDSNALSFIVKGYRKGKL
jgi:hypothetical protein